MAKLLGPDFLNLQVRDLSASRAFYIEVLGLKVDERFDTPDIVVFDTTSIPFALSAAKVNLDEAPPFDGPFGRTFVFADPDGYRITANENPWDRFPLGGRSQS
jgi:catechol 2,3-dioxygenase-like lactoylglutathione lyase family enzyme